MTGSLVTLFGENGVLKNCPLVSKLYLLSLVQFCLPQAISQPLIFPKLTSEPITYTYSVYLNIPTNFLGGVLLKDS